MSLAIEFILKMLTGGKIPLKTIGIGLVCILFYYGYQEITGTYKLVEDQKETIRLLNEDIEDRAAVNLALEESIKLQAEQHARALEFQSVYQEEVNRLNLEVMSLDAKHRETLDKLSNYKNRMSHAALKRTKTMERVGDTSLHRRMLKLSTTTSSKDVGTGSDRETEVNN